MDYRLFSYIYNVFFTRQPISRLSPVIEQIWYCNHFIETPQRTLTLPFGRIEMVIKLDGAYTIEKDRTRYNGTHGWISGQQDGSSLSTIGGAHECIGIVFTPFGWKALSNIPASEFRNCFITITDLVREFDDIPFQLMETKTPFRKMDILEKKLLAMIREHSGVNHHMRQALHYIQLHETRKITVLELCRLLGLSRKSLNTYFQDHVGLSASEYLQQRFFFHLLSRLCGEREKRLIDHTYEHHFFDQSHFIRQFHRYSGMTPGDYLRCAGQGKTSALSANFISM